MAIRKVFSGFVCTFLLTGCMKYALNYGIQKDLHEDEEILYVSDPVDKKQAFLQEWDSGEGYFAVSVKYLAPSDPNVPSELKNGERFSLPPLSIRDICAGGEQFEFIAETQRGFVAGTLKGRPALTASKANNINVIRHDTVPVFEYNLMDQRNEKLEDCFYNQGAVQLARDVIWRDKLVQAYFVTRNERERDIPVEEIVEGVVDGIEVYNTYATAGIANSVKLEGIRKWSKHAGAYLNMLVSTTSPNDVTEVNFNFYNGEAKTRYYLPVIIKETKKSQFGGGDEVFDRFGGALEISFEAYPTLMAVNIGEYNPANGYPLLSDQKDSLIRMLNVYEEKDRTTQTPTVRQFLKSNYLNAVNQLKADIANIRDEDDDDKYTQMGILVNHYTYTWWACHIVSAR